MKLFRLECWSVGASGDENTPPEQRSAVLKGDVYGHPDIPDGRNIYTSHVLKTEGRLVTTVNGHSYELGEIDQTYLNWMHQRGLCYFYDDPFRSVPNDLG